MAKLQVIGGGKMGEALVGGLLRSGTAGADVLIVEKDPARVDALHAALPEVAVADVPAASDGTVLAVKPGDVPAVCAAVAAAGTGRVLSIAAGVTIATLEGSLDAGTPVIRAMPNTPATVGAGAAAIAPGTSAGEDDLAWAEGLLGAVGTVVRVPETLLDAVTGLSGSGPAYVFLVAEALIAAGIEVGLPAGRQLRPRGPDAVRRRHPAGRERRGPRGAPRRGHLAQRHHRRRPGRDGGAGPARGDPRRAWSPPPSGPASSGRPDRLA